MSLHIGQEARQIDYPLLTSNLVGIEKTWFLFLKIAGEMENQNNRWTPERSRMSVQSSLVYTADLDDRVSMSA